MQPVAGLPTVRRMVTGHDNQGRAIFEHEEDLTPLNPISESNSTSAALSQSLGVTLIHRTREFPVRIQGSVEELSPENLQRAKGSPGIVCQIVDLPPTGKDKPPYLHRNQSLDYGVVLKGSMQIILEDGAERTLREGEVYVQK